MSRVYLTNEILRRDYASGNMVKVMDLDSASDFGDLVCLLPPGPLPLPFDEEQVQAAIENGMADVTANDYLIAGGDLVAYGIACSAMVATTGKLRLLYWFRNKRLYRPVEFNFMDGDEE